MEFLFQKEDFTMEEAKITKMKESRQEPQDQSMYQQGRFPSVIDTDDLVFELGKQIVDKINKEKLLENILKKTKALEVGAVEVKKLQIEAERKLVELKNSNMLYKENNKKLDKELVNVKNELEKQKNQVVKIKVENEKFNAIIVDIKADLKNKNMENTKLKQIIFDMKKKFK